MLIFLKQQKIKKKRQIQVSKSFSLKTSMRFDQLNIVAGNLLIS